MYNNTENKDDNASFFLIKQLLALVPSYIQYMMFGFRN